MLPILAVFLGLFGLGGLAVHDFQDHAASDIQSTVRGKQARIWIRSGLDLGVLQGDVREVVLHGSGFSADGLPLFTEPDRPKDGILRRLTLDLRDFQLRDLPVSHLSASIPDCNFDLRLALAKREIRLSRSGIGTATIVLRQQDLETFVLAKYPAIKSVSLKIGEGRLHAIGRGVFGPLPADFSVDAALAIVAGDQLTLSDAVLTLNGKPVDARLRDTLLAQLNRFLDVDEDLHLFHSIRLEKVLLENGLLTMSGAATVPPRLKSQAAGG